MKRLVVVFALLFIASLLTASCASDQTRTKVNTARNVSVPTAAGLPDIEIAEKTIVIDARPSFLFGLEHVPHSINLQWDDFSQADASSKGILQKDLFTITRRLARLGISPDSHVVVIGRGLKGIGEEGRLAWMLQYLGVRDVTITSIEVVKGKLVHTDIDSVASESKYNDTLTDQQKIDRARRAADESTPETHAAPMWKPKRDRSLLATRSELLAVVARDGVRKPLAWHGHDPVLYRVLDVRSPAEYAARTDTSPTTPNIDSVNIEWKEFVTTQGRANLKLKDRLQKVGILTTQRIIVIHDEGVASAEVVMNLRAMGYANAANFAGGWHDLLAGHNPETAKNSASAQLTDDDDIAPIKDDDSSESDDWVDD